MSCYSHIHAAGPFSHLLARGKNGQVVYLNPADYEAFLKVLQHSGREELRKLLNRTPARELSEQIAQGARV